MNAPMSILIAVLLAVVALAMFQWYIPSVAAPDVVRRFEHGTQYEKDAFRDMNRETAQKYVSPILFPLDLIMMACWAAALALGSVALGTYVPSIAGKVGLLIALPVVYFVADLVEDSLIAWFLTNPAAATDARVTVLKALTNIKKASLALAHVQVGILVIWAGVASFRAA